MTVYQTPETLKKLKEEMKEKPQGEFMRKWLMARGYQRYLLEGFTDGENVTARAYAFEELMRGTRAHVYDNDLIVGSVRGIHGQPTDEERELGGYLELVDQFSGRNFWTNSDHFAPNYRHFLSRGIGGVLEDIEQSKKEHPDRDSTVFLCAAERCMKAFAEHICAYAAEAERKGNSFAAENCRAVAYGKPKSFAQALQLCWFVHTAFWIEGRYAMALGRMDQYLYPFYEADRAEGKIDRAGATELLANALYKIGEAAYYGDDNVVNIAIGGVNRDGSNAENELTFAVLDAVRACNIPGPNLSARIHSGISDEFLDEALKLIGTGLGYPALMNDEVNIPALARHGYAIEDARDYCMVGCIENFLQGMQPPWSDGRFNTPKYLELALNNGCDMFTEKRTGPATGKAEDITSMEQFMEALEEQLRYGAACYVNYFRIENEKINPKSYMQPFLSCFCDDCIARAKDINDGGAKYPSVHGACGMGIATVADSLAVIEELVFRKKAMTLAQMRDVLKADFEGYEKERQMMLAVPKYGNDCPETDKYAVWFVKNQDELFTKYHTRDGGDFYTAIASNVSNIPAGREIAATPDGRKAREPVSDAASPMHGMDHCGPTAVVNSVTKPDYTLVSCGTVVNQKYTSDVFTDEESRKKLLRLIRVYFEKGGQEMQINAVSRQTLIDAMEHPENYRDLIVRVSGFSAYYIHLGKEVQLDILKRTEHS